MQPMLKNESTTSSSGNGSIRDHHEPQPQSQQREVALDGNRLTARSPRFGSFQKKDESVDAANDNTTASSTNGGGNHNNRKSITSKRIQKVHRSVWIGRICFVSCLVVVAIALGAGAFYIASKTEHEFATAQFESISDRALQGALQVTKSKRYTLITMAGMISEQLPLLSNPSGNNGTSAHDHDHQQQRYGRDGRDWPFVTVDGYARIIRNLVKSGSHENMGFAPLVSIEEQEEWEQFAYDYFDSRPDFPTTTAVNGFGKGIWRIDNHLNHHHHYEKETQANIVVEGDDDDDGRVHDNDEQTQNRSPYDIMSPVLHISSGPSSVLLFNLHSEPKRRVAINGILECANDAVSSLRMALQQQQQQLPITNTNTTMQQQNQTLPPLLPLKLQQYEFEPYYPYFLLDESCGTITDFAAIEQFETHGPASIMMQPIFPTTDDPSRLLNYDTTNNSSTAKSTIVSGILFSPIVWYEIFENLFNRDVMGIHCVLESDTKVHTFTIRDGVVKEIAEGDLHQLEYDNLGVSADLTPSDLYSIGTMYKLSLYPTDEFYQQYSTDNPRNSTIVAVIVIAVTASFFLLYDFYVRKEARESNEILEAKRRFIRYVSHEVRTPLNAVCMGLNVIQTELGDAMGYLSAHRGENEANDDDDLRSTHNKKTAECMNLLEEVQINAQSAVDVLNDVLNYDKVENSSLSLEITMIPMFLLIEKTIAEFKLPAAKKRIYLKVIYEQSESPITASAVCDSKNKPNDIEQASPSSMVVSRVNELPCDVQNLRVAGDSSRIAQVLRNLLSNALKFTPTEGTIVVRTSYVQQSIRFIKHGTSNSSPRDRSYNSAETSTLDTIDLDNGEKVAVEARGHVLFNVEDSGAGMTKEQLGRLFGEGVQFNVNELQAGQGSGLGLFITKGLVEQHRGTLVATSDGLGTGCTFSVQLPLYQVPGMELPNNNKCNSKATSSTDVDVLGDEKLRILVVDDVLSNRKLLSRLLEKKGHTCDMAENGQVAVDMVNASMSSSSGTLYDTVLCDYEMPIMNGPTAACEIRKLGSDVFLVGITGNMLNEDVQHFKRMGANVVLPKPVQLAVLEEVLVEHGVLNGGGGGGGTQSTYCGMDNSVSRRSSSSSIVRQNLTSN